MNDRTGIDGRLAGVSPKHWGELIYETSPVGIAVAALGGRFLMANSAYQRMIGYTEAELLELSPLDLGMEADRSAALDRMSQMATGAVRHYQVEKRYRRKGGSVTWVRATISPIRTGPGLPQRVLMISEDITERKHAADELRKQKEILQVIFDHIPVMIDLHGADSRPKLVNREWECTVGWTLEEIQHSGVDVFSELYPERQDRQRLTDFINAAQGGWIDFKPRVRDGRTLDTMWTEVRLSDGARIGIGVDITERKRTEEALRESEARLRQLAEHIDDVFWMVDPEARQMLYVSPAYEQVWGRNRESLYRDMRSFMDAIHPEDRQRFVEAYEEQFRNPKPMEKEYRVIRPDGSMCWICDRSFPVRNAAGEVYRFVGISKDITEQKRATEALARANESAARADARHRLMFNSVSDALFVLTADGRFTEVNDSACRYLGYTREELLQLRFADIAGPELKLDIPTIMQACLAKGQALYEGNNVAKDGRRIPVEVKIDLICIDGAQLLVSAVRDISDRKNAERQYREIFDGAIEGVYRTSLEGKPMAANPAIARMLGYDSAREGLSAISDTARQLWVDPDGRAAFMQQLKRHGAVHGYECQFKCKDGTAVWVSLNSRIVYGEGGRALYIEGFIEDITSRKKADARIESAREEERARLARELHDELGQALTGIKMDLISLSRYPPQALVRAKRWKDTLKLIDDTIASVRRISADLRPGMLDDLGLVATVEWAAQEFEARTGTKCALELAREELAVEPAVATALFRILQESLTNIARHAEATECSVRLAEDGDGVRLQVHDDGKGFDEARLSHGGSLGILGMRERALLVDGRLTIESSPGRGVTVTAWAPVRRKKESGSD